MLLCRKPLPGVGISEGELGESGLGCFLVGNSVWLNAGGQPTNGEFETIPISRNLSTSKFLKAICPKRSIHPRSHGATCLGFKMTQE